MDFTTVISPSLGGSLGGLSTALLAVAALVMGPVSLVWGGRKLLSVCWIMTA